MGALEELHQILHGKKFRGNNIVLERVMVRVLLYKFGRLR